MDFKGKIAVVTGASRGIGKRITLDLARRGADVALLSGQGPDAAAEEASEFGGRTLSLSVDVSSAEAVNGAFTTIQKEMGSIDFLVNNAGITRDNLLMRMKDEEWDRVLDVNLKGAFHCLRAVTRPMMKQRSGKIVNISSVIGLIGNPGQVNYAASKGGLIAMTKAASKELAGRGITVNCVAPGFIETDMTAALPEEAREMMTKAIPLGRPGRPEDISGTTLFLLSSAADYITGEVIAVDGGMTLGPILQG